MDLKELIRLAESLDNRDKQQLIRFLQSETKGATAPTRVIDEIQEQKHKDGLVCPHCHIHTVVRFGKYTITTCAGEVKRQRYRCKSCLQTFNDLTNTPLQRTRRPHLWVRFIEMMNEGFSLRLNRFRPKHFKVKSKWTRPTSCTRKRAGGILPNASRVSAAEKRSTVASAMTKSAYWSPETVRR